MSRLFIGLLLIIILVSMMSSYKIETFDIPGTVVDSSINPRLNTYNCYDYIRKKFPKWNVNSYSNSELTVLGTMRTGINNTYQILGNEPQYTQSCVIPVEHGFLYNADSKFEISSCNIFEPYHKLPLNNVKSSESPNGFVVDFSQPNNLTGIDYTDEKNFRDLLTSGYNVLDSYNLNIIHTLSNQLWVDPFIGPEKQEAGLSNLDQDYIRTEVKKKNIMNGAISTYKPMCMMDPSITGTSDNFMTPCTGSQQNDVTTMCCPEESPCKKKLREIPAINAMISLNTINIDKMNADIKYIDDNMPSISTEAGAQNPPPSPAPPPLPPTVAPKTLEPIIIVAKKQNPTVYYHAGVYFEFDNGQGWKSKFIAENVSTVSIEQAQKNVAKITNPMLNSGNTGKRLIQTYVSFNNNKSYEYFPVPSQMPKHQNNGLGYDQSGSPDGDYRANPVW